MTPTDASKETRRICAMAPVIPVLVVEDVVAAPELARSLMEGGLSVLEITLRTDAAIEAIRAMAQIDGAVVGAGTLLTPQDVRDAKSAGAAFGVSPGATDSLLRACEDADLPLLPGSATATEAMRLLERGYTMQKYFPAEAAGGAPALKALSGPLPQISFCPTGGISPQKAPDYLAIDNVLCVGGSWVAPKKLVTDGDWPAITALAASAAKL